MKRGFTLIELLVVVGIMGMLGMVAVGGYSAAVRGMENRSAITAAQSFLQAARQRAEIDRKPVAVFCWNELMKAESDTDNAKVVGRAVAVRQFGRITGISGDNDLRDEFGDLNYGGFDVSDNPTANSKKRLYKITGNTCEYATISTEVTEDYEETTEYSYMKSSREDRGNEEAGIGGCYFRKLGGNAEFKVGDAYGFEFAEMTLPEGYLFGSNYPNSMAQPITDAKKFFLKADGKGTALTIDIYTFMQGKGGAMTTEKVGTADGSKK